MQQKIPAELQMVPGYFPENKISNAHNYLVKPSILDYLKSGLDHMLAFHPPLWVPLQCGSAEGGPPL